MNVVLVVELVVLVMVLVEPILSSVGAGNTGY
jgi:hypothetical protein